MQRQERCVYAERCKSTYQVYNTNKPPITNSISFVNRKKKFKQNQKQFELNTLKQFSKAIIFFLAHFHKCITHQHTGEFQLYIICGGTSEEISI